MLMQALHRSTWVFSCVWCSLGMADCGSHSLPGVRPCLYHLFLLSGNASIITLTSMIMCVSGKGSQVSTKRNCLHQSNSFGLPATDELVEQPLYSFSCYLLCVPLRLAGLCLLLYLTSNFILLVVLYAGCNRYGALIGYSTLQWKHTHRSYFYSWYFL